MKKFMCLMFFWSLLISLHAQTYDKANPPTNVTTGSSSDGYGIIIKWKAAENSSGYEIFCQMEGSKIITRLGGGGNSDMTTDTYEFFCSLEQMVGNRVNILYTYREKRWRFGVRSIGKIDSGGRTSGPSDIIWTGYINIFP
jgi:hypothetical protein